MSIVDDPIDLSIIDNNPTKKVLIDNYCLLSFYRDQHDNKTAPEGCSMEEASKFYADTGRKAKKNGEEAERIDKHYKEMFGKSIDEEMKLQDYKWSYE